MLRLAQAAVFMAAAVLGLGACDGLVSAPLDSEFPLPVEKELCETPRVATQPLRRLSRTQYINTVRDLIGGTLGQELASASTFPPTIIDHGFSSAADANVVSSFVSNAIEDNAELLANALVTRASEAIPQLLPCIAQPGFSDADIDGCIDAFITQFGRRVYRRPLTTDETAGVRDIYDAVRYQGAVTAWGAVMQFFLQAPAMLYFIERGRADAGPAPGLMQLTDYEIATRLSYFLLNTTPDETLLGLAETNALRTTEQLEAQARRLMALPAFETSAGVFHREWLELQALNNATDELRSSLLEEPRALVSSLLAEDAATLPNLLGTTSLPLNSVLEPWYGADPVSSGPLNWVRREVPNRVGLLSQAVFARAHSKAGVTSPIPRGAFIQKNILCADLPGLPDDLDIQGAIQATAQLPTARQRISPSSERSECRVCHQFINPPGLAMESYDAMGRFRESENGVSIDASGDLRGAGPDNDGPFTTTTEMLQKLSTSDVVADCYATKWIEHALGRRLYVEDECSVAAVQTSFRTENKDLRELVVAVVRSDAFRYRQAPEVNP